MSKTFISALLMLAASNSCFAIDPQRALSQYVRERWGPTQGLPRGSIYSITQTPDGYLWVGTESGLLRYDGAVFNPVIDRTATTRATGVLELLPDRSGDLWILRMDASLRLYRAGAFTNPISESPNNVKALSKNNSGDVIVAWYQDGAFTVSGGKMQPFAHASNLPRSPVLALAQTLDGAVWLGMRGSGLYRVSEGKTKRIEIPGNPDPKVNCLLADKDGGLWIGLDNGLARWNGKESDAPLEIPPLVGSQVLAMTRDRDGNLWMGTNSRGLVRLNAGGVAFLDPANYASTAIGTVFEDREGSIWFGSTNGVERLRDSPFITFSGLEGLPTDGPNPVFVDSLNRTWFPPVTGGLWWMKNQSGGQLHAAGLEKDVVYSIDGRPGELWVGRQRGGLTWLRTDGGLTAKTFTTANGLAQNSVYSVHVTREGAVWAGTLSGGASRLVQGRFTNFMKKDGLASNTIASILEDKQGAIWFATPEGLSEYRNDRLKTYTTADGLSGNNVNCLYEDSQGTLWVGTSSGLAMRKGDGFGAPPSAPGELRDSILGIADDAMGTLWIATSARVLSVPRDTLIKGAAAHAVREYGVADGLRGTEGVKRYRSLIRDSSGRIWISLNHGISMIDPARVAAASSATAIVRIQSISADGRSLTSESAFHVAPGSRRIEFGYAGLNLSIPSRVRYRYRVDPYDSAWSEPVADRKAAYTNLGPGSYTFRVMASNPEGVWSPEEASILFRVDPQFWQTLWFQILASLALIMASVLIYQWRVRLLTQKLNMRFEERMAERTRIGQELHDTLLQGFLSASMQLHLISDRIPEESTLKPPLEKVMDLMKRVIDEGRNAVRGLRSPGADDLDLSKALSRIPFEFPASENTVFQIAVKGDQQPLRPLLRDEVYRIGREAVVNAFRHASASTVQVEIEYGRRQFRLVVRDNGTGMDAETLRTGKDGHWGMPGMRERAARIGAALRLTSNPSNGTKIELAVPASIAFRSGADSRRREE